jgi:hypothetical protein
MPCLRFAATALMNNAYLPSQVINLRFHVCPVFTEAVVSSVNVRIKQCHMCAPKQLR